MKARSSKLDQFAATLADMDAEKKTLAEMIAWLKGEGCSISAGTLSEYLSAQRSARRQALMLSRIASGARQHQEVKTAFAKNPAPEIETLVKLHQVLIMQLSTQSLEDPELVKLADQLTRTVMEFISGQTKAELEKQKLALGERRVALLEKKAAAFDQAKGVAENKQLTPEQKQAEYRRIFGMS